MIIQSMPYPATVTPAGPSFNYFANNGVTTPTYGSTTSPCSIYVSSTDTTWFAWEGLWAGRVVFVRTYNHTTRTWTDPVIVSTNTLNGDDHGVPTLLRDADGYVHCFFGSHNSNQQHSYTASPDDPSAWTAGTALSGTYSYPKPVLIGSTIYLFLRDGTSGVTNCPLVVIPSTSVSSGVVTWGTKKTLADPEGALRLYTGQPTVVGSKVHIPGSISDQFDNFRRHVYYLVYDTANGDLENHDNSTSTASGSLPILKATMDSSYRIVDQGSNGGNVPDLCIDASGDPHLAYLDGTGSSYAVKHIVRTSGTWGSATTVDTIDDRYGGLSLLPLSGGVVHLYYDKDAGSFTRGGDIMRAIRSGGGTWGSGATILAATDYGLTSVASVLNAHADARVTFCEHRDSGSGELRVYAYGDSGFLTEPEAYETETLTLVAAFTTPPTQRRKELIDSVIASLKATGVWTKLDALHVYAVADSQAALVNWITPGTFNASLTNAPTFTADRSFATNGTNSHIDSGFNPATAGGHFTQNSAMFAIYSRTSAQTSGAVAGWFDGTDGVTLRPRSTTNIVQIRINQASGNDSTSTVPAGDGLIAVNRSGASALQIYREGASVGSGTTASTALNSHSLDLGRITASSYTAFSFALDAIGQSLTSTEHSNFRKAVQTYMLSVGAA